MFIELQNTFEIVSKIEVSNQRKEVLKPFIDYIQKKVNNKEAIRLNFICTHNSRRSHLCQIWAQTMTFYFKIDSVFCFSGGTETTAMFYKVVETLQNQGFEIQKLNEDQNPKYEVKFNENQQPIIGFSKTYDDKYNPATNFAAIMTCSNADEGCPTVFGAEGRFSIQYDDPKLYDETDIMNEKYAERSLQIASEMYFVFSKISLI